MLNFKYKSVYDQRDEHAPHFHPRTLTNAAREQSLIQQDHNLLCFELVSLFQFPHKYHTHNVLSSELLTITLSVNRNNEQTASLCWLKKYPRRDTSIMPQRQ